MGQPTHFLTRRRFGMFIVTVPKEFAKTQKFRWTLTANGATTTMPFHMHTDYNITPLKSSGGEPEPRVQHAAVLRFAEAGPAVRRSAGHGLQAGVTRTATVGTPMPLDVWADDDALLQQRRQRSDERAPAGHRPRRHQVSRSGHGHGVAEPGEVRRAEGRQAVASPTRARASTTVSFSEPGDYLLHVNGGDYSGNGGGGSGCCWTTAIMKVTVAGATRTGGN